VSLCNVHGFSRGVPEQCEVGRPGSVGIGYADRGSRGQPSGLQRAVVERGQCQVCLEHGDLDHHFGDGRHGATIWPDDVVGLNVETLPVERVQRQIEQGRQIAEGKPTASCVVPSGLVERGCVDHKVNRLNVVSDELQIVGRPPGERAHRIVHLAYTVGFSEMDPLLCLEKDRQWFLNDSLNRILSRRYCDACRWAACADNNQKKEGDDRAHGFLRRQAADRRVA
jgi:hypothetical protein